MAWVGKKKPTSRIRRDLMHEVNMANSGKKGRLEKRLDPYQAYGGYKSGDGKDDDEDVDEDEAKAVEAGNNVTVPILVDDCEAVRYGTCLVVRRC